MTDLEKLKAARDAAYAAALAAYYDAYDDAAYAGLAVDVAFADALAARDACNAALAAQTKEQDA
jgi:hypothetical protein